MSVSSHLATDRQYQSRVLKYLDPTDFSSDQFRAVVDAFTGFAAVSTPQAVYVWNYAKVSTVDIVVVTFSSCAD